MWLGAWELLRASSAETGGRGLCPVGSYPEGASPYGVFDMAGNASEWVADWYAFTDYSQLPDRNPFSAGPEWNHALRGSAWYDPNGSPTWQQDQSRCAARNSSHKTSDPRVGFRCARSSADLLPTSQPSIRVAPSQRPPLTPTHSPAFTPLATSTSAVKPTASPTPFFVFDLSSYDPDIYQPIDVSHNPPLIARSDETVRLVFDLVNPIYCPDLQRYCRLEPFLYYTYTDADAFQSLPLTRETVNESESLVARLPAADHEGRSLRYYAEFAVPEAGYTLRFPGAGTIDLFTTDNFIPVDLPAANAVKTGEVVYDFLWGYGPDKVRSTVYSPYGHRAGPTALDVASDGRIALMDPVNERIIIFNPNAESFSNVPLPFTYKFNGTLAFDQADRLMVCDFQGEEAEGSGVSIPYCYRLLPAGELDVAAPMYAKFPEKITRDHQVLDGFDSRLVAPFNSQGEANSRETQRLKFTWELPYRLVEGDQGLSPFLAHFADLEDGVAFEVHSGAGLGQILGFEKTPQGYLVIFSSVYEQIRAVWIDPAGAVLKDVTLPNGQYSEMSFDGQTAVAQDGSLYVMSSTQKGMEVHFVEAPWHQTRP